MNIEDIIQLLNNRLREFKLSKDYASMSGNLEGVNTADKEIISLEDTLFKLNLLIDTSKSAAVKETTLAEVIIDGSVAVLGDYDITPYATDPKHEEKIMNILSKMGVMDTAEKVDDYIKGKYWSSPVTGEMIMNAASAYSVDARLMMAIMEQDSSFGTAGKAVRTLNPGNVGNNDAGDTVTYESWQEGVTAVARWLSRHRVSKIISEIPDMATSTPSTATSTPETIPVTTSTTTTTTATSTLDTTPTTATSTPVTTPETIPVTTSTTTTTTATSTPAIDTSTPEAATPVVGSSATTTGQASTPEILPVTTSTTTTTTATSTPTAATSTPTTATSTPEAAIPTPEIPPITTSTTTTATATSTPTTATSTPETATSTPEIPPITTSTTTTTTATSTE